MIFKPHAYQQHCIEKVVEVPKLGLFLDKGKGQVGAHEDPKGVPRAGEPGKKDPGLKHTS